MAGKRLYLTKEEEKMYKGEYGPAREWAMKFMVQYGEALGAEKTNLYRISICCMDIQIGGKDA
jgi:predicted aconitase